MQKTTQMKNPFSQETRQLYIYNYKCWECGENGSRTGGIELHHILGRISNSPLNSAPLCHKCHAQTNQKQTSAKYFLKTLCYLIENQYKLTPADQDFVIKNWEFLKSQPLDLYLSQKSNALS